MIERDIKKLLSIWGLLIQFLQRLRGKKKEYSFSGICEAANWDRTVASEYQESEIIIIIMITITLKKKKEYTQTLQVTFSLIPFQWQHSWTFRKVSKKVKWKGKK